MPALYASHEPRVLSVGAWDGARHCQRRQLMEAPPQPVPPVAAWDGDNDDDPLGEKAPVQWPYVLDIEEAIDMLEPDPPFLRSQRTKEMVDAARLMRVLEDAIRRGVERPEWLDAPERKPLSALELEIAHLDTKNPYTVGSELYKTHEIHRAMHVTQHNDVGTRLVDELLRRATERWSERAAILKRHFPEARLSAPNPQGTESSDYQPGYKTVHLAFAMLRVLQLWHGASSKICEKAARSVASGIEKRGAAGGLRRLAHRDHVHDAHVRRQRRPAL